MEERGIIIADRDAEYRSQVAEFFSKAGYRVETTDSAIHVLCSILEKQTPVLLLGSDFDQKISSADLIHLLKKCNRHLHVIMVSDEMPLALARKVRQEGIFYHALKPATLSDTQELGQAVQCAFERHAASAQADPAAAPQLQPVAAASEGAGLPELDKAPVLRALPWITGMVALIFGSSYLSVTAAEAVQGGSSLAIWLFLVFCALIVTGQVLPIFRIRLVLRRGKVRQAKECSSSGDPK